MRSKMNRRDFLKAAFGTAVYFAATKVFPADTPPVFDVGIAVGKDYAKSVERAIDLVGGIRKYVKPGSVVVVKPNIGWNSPPELKANTDPIVVRTVVHLCFQALASKVYVFDRTCNNPKLTYVRSGIADAAKSAGASVLFVDDVSDKLYKKIRIQGASFLEETLVNRYILESDVLINVPVAKDHSSARLTIGMKNLMGITGDNRSKWHWELHDAIADINLGVKSHLTVVDATYIMLDNGPTGGSKNDLKRLDTIVASPDVVSADSETSLLFGIAPGKIDYINKAAEKGLGKMDKFTKKVENV
jgi:uncharacterized protein (DUF362 family)